VGRTLLIFAALVAYQILLYAAVGRMSGNWLGVVLVVVPIVVGCVWFALVARNRRSALSMVAILVLSGLLFSYSGADHLYWVTNVVSYVALLWFFARTLSPGSEAIVTTIARTVHGNLPPAMEHYTRQTTVAWCGFFGFMALASVLLFIYAPIGVWSFFANVLNLPLVLLMFIGEYCVRIWRHPEFQHVSLIGTIRAVTQHYTAKAKATQPR
jgi:uncharacterized membrane protein